jgi:hypothetical protein
MGCNALQSVEIQPKFCRNMSPPSSGPTRISGERNRRENRLPQLGLFFDLEDGGNMLL